MNTIKGIARSSVIIEFDGDEETLVNFTDAFTAENDDEQLDSLDIGDALGYWDFYFRMNCDYFHGKTIPVGEFTLKLSMEIENYVWQGI